MGVRPDADTLQSRLGSPAYSRLIKKADHFQGKTIHDFCAFLNVTVQRLTEADVLAELSDYLPPSELPGLHMRFRAEIAKLL